MALFTAAQFSNGYDRPVGVTGQPAHPGDAVTLALSDGTQITIFDTLETALKLANFMRTHKQWTVAASEDVTIALANGGIKMLVCENTLRNQKLLTSFVPVYVGDELQFVHRSMSCVVSLTEALRSVGFCVKSATPFAGSDCPLFVSAHKVGQLQGCFQRVKDGDLGAVTESERHRVAWVGGLARDADGAVVAV